MGTHRKPEFLRLLRMGTASTFPSCIGPIVWAPRQAQGYWTLLSSSPQAGCQLSPWEPAAYARAQGAPDIIPGGSPKGPGEG